MGTDSAAALKFDTAKEGSVAKAIGAGESAEPLHAAGPQTDDV